MLKKGTGLVMEASFDTLVVMTPSGEFINLPWRKEDLPELGSEIEFTTPVVSKNNFFSLKKLGVLAASIIFLLLAIPFVAEYFYPMGQEVIAYVGIDINPSLELGVDKEGVVKEVRGLNEDGKQLLQGLDFNNLSVNKALKLITEEAVARQYITAEKENNIIITYCSERSFPEIAQELTAEIKNELNLQNIEAQVEMLEIEPKFYEKAQKAQLSPGKYAVVLQAREEGIEVDPEAAKFSGVVQAIKAAGGNPGQIISHTKQAEKQLIKMDKEREKEIKKQQKESAKQEKLKEKNEKKNEKKNQVNKEKKSNQQNDQDAAKGKNGRDRDEVKNERARNKTTRRDKDK